MDTLLKHNLLITHGTVYGILSEGDISSVPGMTNSREQWNYVGYDWRSNSFTLELQPAYLRATVLTSLHLPDLYSQSAVGTTPFNALAAVYEKPNMLLTRL